MNIKVSVSSRARYYQQQKIKLVEKHQAFREEEDD